MRFRDLLKRGVERLNGDRDGDSPSAGSHLQLERRDERRVARFGWARYDSGEIEGQGLVTNLSMKGAMVERCSDPLRGFSVSPGAKRAALVISSGSSSRSTSSWPTAR